MLLGFQDRLSPSYLETLRLNAAFEGAGFTLPFVRITAYLA